VKGKGVSNMDKSNERRASVRTPFVSKGFCHVGEIDKKYCGVLRDISIIGLFLKLNDCPNVGYQCDITIVFEGDHSRLTIEDVSGVIIRREEDGVAVRFDERLEWFLLIPLYFHKMRDLSQVG
jgi:hypothetical protein